MSIIASWKTATFEVSRNRAVSIQDLSLSYVLKESKQNKKQSKKHSTTKKGLEPVSMNFTTSLCANAGVNIRKEMEAWKKLVGEVDYIKIGGKKFGPKMKLKKVSISKVLIDDAGRFRVADLSMEFEEYKKKKKKKKVKSSAKKVKGSKAYKKTKKKKNKKLQAAKTKKKTIVTGKYVKISGSSKVKKYMAAGMTKKQATAKHKVTKVDETHSQVAVKVGSATKWLSMADITLSTAK